MRHDMHPDMHRDMRHELQKLKEQGQARELKCLESNGALISYQGRDYLNLSSNDYLGISARIDFQKEFIQSLDLDHFWMSASSSRLLTGNHPCAVALEAYLESLYGKSCLLYNSGYHANSGILPAITGKKDLILADKLVHASIIDGMRLCACEWRRYQHNDYSHLERLLQQAQGKYEQIYIVTESVFSMDGDMADIAALVELKKRYGARLYVDEAHGFGVYGARGLGLVEALGLLDHVDLIMCTLGKAAASEGAFVVCDTEVREWLINHSRTLIFTTATPAINLAWTHFVIRKIVGMTQERMALQAMTERFRAQLVRFQLLGCSPIVPMLMGDNEPCNRLAAQLQQAGIWVMPIRYPTVPAGQARIRFSLTAALIEEQVQKAYETVLAHTEQ